jgi:outer membrane protein TolC
MAESARWEAAAAGFRYVNEIRDVRARTIGAAWGLWYAEQALRANQEVLDLMRDFERSTRAQYESGMGSQRDVLRAGIEVARLETERAALTNDLLLARTRVNRELGAASDTDRSAAGVVEPSPEMPPLDWHLNRVQGQDALLRADDRMVRARTADLAVARKENRPKFEVRVEARQFEDGNGIDEVDTGLFASLPWIWRDKHQGRMARATEELAAARRMLDDRRLMARLEANERYRDADNARRQVLLYNRQVVPDQRRLVGATRADYEAGKTAFFELADAERALEEALLARAGAVSEFASARARLDALSGPYGEEERATGLVLETDALAGVEQP